MTTKRLVYARGTLGGAAATKALAKHRPACKCLTCHPTNCACSFCTKIKAKASADVNAMLAEGRRKAELHDRIERMHVAGVMSGTPGESIFDRDYKAPLPRRSRARFGFVQGVMVDD